MILAVSTVKDTAPHVRDFVARNLANGVDHLVVFTEDTGAEAEAVLDAHPAVTHVPTGGDWWPERPSDLNERQRNNANLARVLLAPFAWAEWLVHIDGDEVALIDRDVVAAIPPGRSTFRMDPLEAVSRHEWPEGRVTHFKRLLERPELQLLKVLGLIAKPDNKSYFHGHVRGKVGVRLRTDHRLGLHVVKSGRGRWTTTNSEPGLAVLHYDSVTVEEFVRKFMTLAESGSKVVYRTTRIPVVNALRTLASLDLADDVRATYLHRVYETSTVEDFDTLDDLGFLEQVDPDTGTHVPHVVPADDLAAFEALLAAAATMPRTSLDLDPVEGGYDVLRAALQATGLSAGPATEVLAYIDRKAAAAREAVAAQQAEAAAAVAAPQPGRRRRLRLPGWGA